MRSIKLCYETYFFFFRRLFLWKNRLNLHPVETGINDEAIFVFYGCMPDTGFGVCLLRDALRLPDVIFFLHNIHIYNFK
jgi:hypothetical protein